MPQRKTAIKEAKPDAASQKASYQRREQQALRGGVKHPHPITQKQTGEVRPKTNIGSKRHWAVLSPFARHPCSYEAQLGKNPETNAPSQSLLEVILHAHATA
jgi:hypothetical protein